MKNYVFIIILVIIGWHGAIAQSSSVRWHQGDWESLVSIAEQTGKLIYIDAYTSWCVPCQEMDRVVFKSARVGSELNQRSHNIKLNTEKGMGQLLAARYGIQVIPSHLWVSADGTLVYQTEGYLKVDQMISHSKLASEPHRLRTARESRYADGDRKPDFLYNFLADLKSRQDPRYDQVLYEFLDAQQDWTQPGLFETLQSITASISDRGFNYLIAHREALGNGSGTAQVETYIEGLLNKYLYADHAPPMDRAQTYMKRVYGSALADRYDRYRLDRLSRSTDSTAYHQALRDYYTTHPDLSPSDRMDLVQTLSLRAHSPTDWELIQQILAPLVSVEDNYLAAFSASQVARSQGRIEEASAQLDRAREIMELMGIPTSSLITP